MGLFKKLGEEIEYIKLMSSMQNWLKGIDIDNQETIVDDWERICDKYNAKTAFIFEDKTLTYGQFDNLANRYANWALSYGLRAGDVVAIFMNNRPEYVAAWYGLAKIGVISALINNQLVGNALIHCIKIAKASAIIIDNELVSQWNDVAPSLANVTPFVRGVNIEGIHDLDRALNAQSNRRPNKIYRSALRAMDPCLYIYTSGTTGHPKAATLTNGRTQGISRVFIAGTGCNDKDIVYIPLPLFHSTGGLAAIGIALNTGATIVLKSKFSATSFWDDIVKHNCTIFSYIGEMFRYLIAQPINANESGHKLKSCFGNGLRPDVWDKAEERFKIPKIVEFYGSTEGTVFFVNVTGKKGSVGRIPKYLKKRFNVEIVKFDVDAEAPIRGEDGLCILCDFDETGEVIGLLKEGDPRATFSGYANDEEATNKKVLRNVLTQGDAYFRTGDLMRQDKDGYYYFVDRIGDTFRWKAENVSTLDVMEALTIFPNIFEAVVYGVSVPENDGRAGMAQIVLTGEVNFDELLAHLYRELPKFAIPLFLRIGAQTEVTGTFKYKKTDLVRQGFDINQVNDEIFWLDPSIAKYRPLAQEDFAKISSGQIRF